MNVFIFYSCNSHKDRSSMRVEKVFANTIKGRKELANYIINEENKGYIDVIDLSDPEIMAICMSETPNYINNYMDYGFIESEDVEG